MNRREFLVALAASSGLVGGCATPAPSWVRGSRAHWSAPVPLPAPRTTGVVALEEAIAERRSMRSFGAGPLPLATIGQLLWAAQGITAADGKRTAPSAGARYPLELYVVTPDEVMHYLPAEHSVETRASPDLRPQLRIAAYAQGVVQDAPVVLVVAAVVQRTVARYFARGVSYVDREAGHAAQNVLLQATAYRLAAVPVGGFDPGRAASVLTLPPDQTVLYLVPVGRRP